MDSHQGAIDDDGSGRSRKQQQLRDLQVGCLQFSPKLGEVRTNMDKAERILERDMTPGIGWILLPEMAFSGYNFESKAQILPFLEQTAAGPTTLWARRIAQKYGCMITVGYPEAAKRRVVIPQKSADMLGGLLLSPMLAKVLPAIPYLTIEHLDDLCKRLRNATPDIDEDVLTSPNKLLRHFGIDGNINTDPHPVKGYENIAPYNSLITVNGTGTLIWHYRKSHLYYTDEPWAEEGPGQPFSNPSSTPRATSHESTVSAKHFELYVDPTRQPGFTTQAIKPTNLQRFPSFRMDGIGTCTMGICMDINPYRFEASYSEREFANAALDAGSSLVCVSMAWLTTLPPEAMAATPLEPDLHTILYWSERFEPIRVSTIGRGLEGEKYVICANRCGIEGNATYAGSSTVFRFVDGDCCILAMVGKGEETLMKVNLDQTPIARIRTPSPDGLEQRGH